MSRLSDYKTYPELVDPDPEKGYTVVDISKIQKRKSTINAEGVTDKVKRIMAIPLTPDGEYIGRHEMGHAKWSPKKRPYCRSWLMRGCLDVCEEYRVNQGLRLLDIPVEWPVSRIAQSQEKLFESINNREIVETALRVVAARGTNAGDELQRDIQEASQQGDAIAVLVETATKGLDERMERARGQDVVPTFKQLLRIARWLEKLLRSACKAGDDPDGQAYKMIAEMGQGIGNPITLKSHPQPYPEGTGSLHSYGWSRGRGELGKYFPEQSPFRGQSWGGTPPGTLNVVTPKLTIPIVPPELERTLRQRAAEEGTVFRYIERFVSDQRVFKRKAKKRKGGGSVLIDTSGSMGLDDRDVEKIVEGAPEATLIATYSGMDHEGWLKVCVHKGKMLDGCFQTRGGSNVVDLPALEWLSMQAEPRVWLSDGCVTGINDDFSKQINRACDTVMRDNNIVRCEDIKSVVRVLKREPGVGYKSTGE